MKPFKIGGIINPLILVLFLTAGNLSAQIKFQEVIGEANDDRGRSIRATSDTGFIAIGSTYSFGTGGQEVYLIKTNKNGIPAWSKTFGGMQDDDGRGVCQTSDGGYAMVGSTNSFGTGLNDVYLLKADAFGNLMWSAAIGGSGEDYGFIVEETSDGGLIIVGHTDSYGGGGNDVYLIKTTAAGAVAWTKTFGSGGDDRGFSVVQTTDGGYAVAGYTTSYGAGGADAYLIKTDAGGNAQWTKTFGGLYDDQAFSIAQCSDNGYIIAGYANRGNLVTVNNDIYLVKTDATGNLAWSKTFGGAQDDEGNVVRQTAEGGYAVFGFESSTGFGSYDACLLKTDGNGIPVFTKVYGSAGDDLAISGDYLSDNTYVMAGFSDGQGAGNFDVFVVKTDKNGLTNNNCNEQSISFPTLFTTSTNMGYQQGSGFTGILPVSSTSVPVDKLLQMCPPCSTPPVGHNDYFIVPSSASLLVDDNGGIYNWYDDSLAGNLVFTGTKFITPVLTTKTTYYVEHLQPFTMTCTRVPVQAIAIKIDTIKFFIPNLVTPNSDGQNDVFEIQGLPDYSALKIYNRWGEQIFESDFYKNIWAGNNLSDGIYYYDLILSSGQEYKGWLHLLR